jgi:CUG-BP- and ETR3-like factor
MATDEGKLFVGQLPRAFTEADVRPLFEPHGELVEVKVILDRGTGMSKGCAFVRYRARECAQRAIEELHDKVTLPNMRSTLQVSWSGSGGSSARAAAPSSSSSAVGGENKLFFAHVPPTASEEEVRAVFSPYGQLVDLVVLKHADTGRSKGSGFARYALPAQSTAAIQALNGSTPFPGMRSPLEVRWAESSEQRAERLRMPGAGAGPGAGYGGPPGMVGGGYGGMVGGGYGLPGPGGGGYGPGPGAPVPPPPYGGQYPPTYGAPAAQWPGGMPPQLQGGPNPYGYGGYASLMHPGPGQAPPPLLTTTLHGLPPYGYAAAAYAPPAATPHSSSSGGGGLLYAPQLSSSAAGVPPPSLLYGGAGGGGGGGGAAYGGLAPPQAYPAAAGPHGFYPTGADAAAAPAGGGGGVGVGGGGEVSVFVHGLPDSFTDADMAALFVGVGEVVSAKVAVDKASGRTRDFGFVTFTTPEGARAAVEGVSGTVMPHGKRLKVQLKGGAGGGGGGGGGGAGRGAAGGPMGYGGGGGPRG